MNLQRDKEIVDRILEIDFMGTKEFCEKHNYPVPFYTGDVQSSAQLFLNVDAKKWHVIMEFAKQVRRSQPEKALSAEEFLKENEFLPNQHGAYIFNNGGHGINLKLILEDFASEQLSRITQLENIDFAQSSLIEVQKGLISQLESDLAKSQEKCKAYERALIAIQGNVDDSEAEFEASMSNIEEIVYQALNPKE